MKVPLLNIIGCYCVELSNLFMYCSSWFCLGLYPRGVYKDSAKAQRYEMAVLCGTNNGRRSKSDLWLVSPVYTSNWVGCPVCGMWSACRSWGWEWRQVAKSSAWAIACPGKGKEGHWPLWLPNSTGANSRVFSMVLLWAVPSTSPVLHPQCAQKTQSVLGPQDAHWVFVWLRCLGCTAHCWKNNL